jgi:hypothetical protein
MRDFLDTTNTLGSETRAKLDSISSQIQEIVRDRPWIAGEGGSFSTLSTLINLVEQVQSTRTGFS